MKNIILYGMRGSGKTTMGKALGIKLGFEFYDLDKEIEKNIGEVIFTYIDREGWDSFRKKESEVLKIVMNKNHDKVISLGGGTMFFENNLDFLLKRADKLVFIETKLDKIAKRILRDEEKGNKRNLLTDKGLIQELEDVYKSREPVFLANYDFKVENNGKLDECLEDLYKKIIIGNICVPISDFSQENLEKQIGVINSSREIKFVELRIDFISDNEIEKKLDILKNITKQIIITNRKKEEGGNFSGDYKQGISKIEKFKRLGDYFDIELLAGEDIKNLKEIIGEKKLILSYHNFEKTPDIDFLKAKINQMSKYYPDVYKIALMPQNNQDVEKIYELQQYFYANYPSIDYIFISMGEFGKQSRIDLPKKGGLLSFASMSGKTSAPGQIDYKKLYKNLF